MKEKITDTIIRDQAAKVGLIFGACSVSFLLVKQVVSLSGISIFILWAAEFIGCIMMMRYFMRKLVSDFDGVTSRDTFRYGRRIAMFSAIIVAGASLVFMLTISKEAVAEAMNSIIESPMLDSNSRAMLEDMQDKIPVIAFFSNLIYCYLYGTCLSKILSLNIPEQNPFAGTSGGNDTTADVQ